VTDRFRSPDSPLTAQQGPGKFVQPLLNGGSGILEVEAGRINLRRKIVTDLSLSRASERRTGRAARRFLPCSTRPQGHLQAMRVKAQVADHPCPGHPLPSCSLRQKAGNRSVLITATAAKQYQSDDQRKAIWKGFETLVME
jgi:hypothetical protein